MSIYSTLDKSISEIRLLPLTLFIDIVRPSSFTKVH